MNGNNKMCADKNLAMRSRLVREAPNAIGSSRLKGVHLDSIQRIFNIEPEYLLSHE